MSFDSPNTFVSFFQTKAYDVTPSIPPVERIAAIRARRIAIQEAQVQLNQKIDALNLTHNLRRPTSGG